MRRRYPREPRVAAGDCRPHLAGRTAATDRTGRGNETRRPDARTADPPRDSFRVGTFNIHGCTGADGRRDVDRVADCLKDLDFVALNEVHGPRFWERDDQAALLGRRLGMPWLFAPATRDWHCIDFGNGLLTSLPVESWQRIPLAASNGRGYRNAVLVRLRPAEADDQRALDPYRPQRRPHPAATTSPDHRLLPRAARTGNLPRRSQQRDRGA